MIWKGMKKIARLELLDSCRKHWLNTFRLETHQIRTNRRVYFAKQNQSSGRCAGSTKQKLFISFHGYQIWLSADNLALKTKENRTEEVFWVMVLEQTKSQTLQFGLWQMLKMNFEHLKSLCENKCVRKHKLLLYRINFLQYWMKSSGLVTCNYLQI